MSSVPKPIPSDEQLSAASDSTQGVPPGNQSGVDSNSAPSSDGSEQAPMVPKRPLMRPVSRPQPPAQPATPPKAAPVAVTPPKAEASTPVEKAPSSEQLLAEQAAMRQQPIPPPSEPKQYRAIGLVRGTYSPSDEQFTRGDLKTSDGTTIEAVLLGRVMSLVRNHLDLAEEHLWVVYPRTRETQDNLHVQIVGVWEPEKLSKDKDSDSSESAEAAATEEDENLSPGYEDDYFSVRGEVVFYAPDEKQIVIKIQQAARKSSSKAKAFKLQLQGVLDSPKTLGYFWELHVKRVGAILTMTDGTPIGLIPPKKKSKSDFRRERRPFNRGAGGGRDQRSGPPHRSGGGASAPPPSRREPLPKPVKRTEQSSEG